jgi:hypothetical protein
MLPGIFLRGDWYFSFVDTAGLFFYFEKTLVEVRRPRVAERFPGQHRERGERGRAKEPNQRELIAAETEAIAEIATVGVPV